ncbi:MAG: hypothetical protein KAI84_05385, partial [Gammaproteobacteria bacterium]|nr:hypothetical protein [Gammaproteobacteria bacterium]
MALILKVESESEIPTTLNCLFLASDMVLPAKMVSPTSTPRRCAALESTSTSLVKGPSYVPPLYNVLEEIRSPLKIFTIPSSDPPVSTPSPNSALGSSPSLKAYTISESKGFDRLTLRSACICVLIWCTSLILASEDWMYWVLRSTGRPFIQRCMELSFNTCSPVSNIPHPSDVRITREIIASVTPMIFSSVLSLFLNRFLIASIY